MDIKKLHLFSVLVLTLMVSVFISNNAFACFDTFVFLHHKSMVYPAGYFAADVLGEYSVNEAGNPDADSYLSTYSMYYGLSNKMSVQFGLTQAETTRTDRKYQLESWTVRGVYNALNAGSYYLDVVAEHHTGIDTDENTVHFSVPNLMYINNFVVVVHPVYEYTYGAGSSDHNFGGHGGVFYNYKNFAIVGVGAEFASAQSGSSLGNRLTEGEAAASIFLGFNIGNVYFQNEFAKGLNNSRDFGFAATLKFFLNTGLAI